MLNLGKKFDLSKKIIVVDFNPTLEGMADYIYKKIKEHLENPNLSLDKVKLRAASTLEATYQE